MYVCTTLQEWKEPGKGFHQCAQHRSFCIKKRFPTAALYAYRLYDILFRQYFPLLRNLAEIKALQISR